MSNADSPANPIKLNERIECPSTGSVTINECDDYFEGLTKREAFAMAAMQGMFANSAGYSSTYLKQVPHCAVVAADFLLKELEGDK